MVDRSPTYGTDPRIRVEGVSKSYTYGRWDRRKRVAAITEISFEINAGETLALVGASGSGKSTVARCVTRLERSDSGRICFDGTDIAQLGRRDLAPFRRKIQIIFQDAITSINPRFSAAEVIEEPLRIQGKSQSERRIIVENLMQEVSLSPDWLSRSVMDFSGGQRQRLAIARALATRPQLLVLDEALSGLDLSTQAQITNLLVGLQESHGLTYLLISHDLTHAIQMADAVAVMSHGRIVEQGSSERVFSTPQHEETKKLIAAVDSVKSAFVRAAGAFA
jgi:peptide/nickel transport system ATP-binding protein